MGNPKGRGQFRRLRSRRKNNIEMDIKEMVWEDMDCLNQNQDRNPWC
jgi:hypothetical protein